MLNRVLLLLVLILSSAELQRGQPYMYSRAEFSGPLAGPPGAGEICSLSNGTEERARSALRALFGEGFTTKKLGFPPGAQFDGIELSGQTVIVYLKLPEPLLNRRQMGFSESDEMTAAVVGTLSQVVPALRHFQLVVKNPVTGSYQPISDFLPVLPSIPKKPFEGERPAAEALSGQPPGFGQNRPQGALSGKTVYLGQSHGWYWHTQLGWITQRLNTNEIVEDFITPEAINQYLVQYLWNAGADVWTCRDRDMNTNEITVDDEASEPGSYTEIGNWSASPGNGHGDGGYRFIETSPAETGKAIWSPNFPRSDFYAVYAFYLAGRNRAREAKYTINHSGGSTIVKVDQQQHGSTWRYLGTYHFTAGRQGSVVLSNEGSGSGQVVIADALRFGGGKGSILRGGGTSNRPRWEEAARYFVQFMGAPAAVYDPLATGQGR